MEALLIILLVWLLFSGPKKYREQKRAEQIETYVHEQVQRIHDMQYESSVCRFRERTSEEFEEWWMGVQKPRIEGIFRSHAESELPA